MKSFGMEKNAFPGDLKVKSLDIVDLTQCVFFRHFPPDVLQPR
jgi:hypothetical protein